MGDIEEVKAEEIKGDDPELIQGTQSQTYADEWLNKGSISLVKEDGSDAEMQGRKPDNRSPLDEEPSSILTPLALISKALDMKVDVQMLKELMDLQDRHDVKIAKKAFDEAMTSFQSECPIIQRQKEGGLTKEGDVAYMYAPLESIVLQIKPILAKYGFSYLIKTEFPEGKVKAICVVRHKQGHQEESIMEVPMMRQTGVMNDSQVVAATSTFAKRYAFCNAFGIMTADEDSDGISEDLLGQFEDIISAYGSRDYIKQVANTIEKSSKFKKWLGTIPTARQSDKLKAALAVCPKKLTTEQLQFIWLNFQKQTNQSFDKWLGTFKQSKLYRGG